MKFNISEMYSLKLHRGWHFTRWTNVCPAACVSPAAKTKQVKKSFKHYLSCSTHCKAPKEVKLKKFHLLPKCGYSLLLRHQTGFVKTLWGFLALQETTALGMAWSSRSVKERGRSWLWSKWRSRVFKSKLESIMAMLLPTESQLCVWGSVLLSLGLNRMWWLT